MSETRKAFLALVPRDGMAFLDAKGWYISASRRRQALPWPHPSTVLGVVRTAWGQATEDAEGRTFTGEDWLRRTAALRLGPSFPIRRSWGGEWQRMWPAPADALATEGQTEYDWLQPVPPPCGVLGGLDEDPAREALWRTHREELGKPQPSPAWWEDAAWVRWLAGLPVARRQDHGGMTARTQVHVGIDPTTQTAKESILYAIEVRETLSLEGGTACEWGIGLQAELPGGVSDLAGNLVTHGADRRLGRWEGLPADLFSMPKALEEAFAKGSSGIRVVACTPLCFQRGWLPDGFEPSTHEGEPVYAGRLPGIDEELILRAAFVGRPVVISGWDMQARQPKPSRRLVPPGSVYHLLKRSGGTFQPAEARSLWLTGIGQDQDQGFGRVVPGVWHPDLAQP